jgi:AAA ATPase-like protein
LPDAPAALILCGERGIGKTTLWQADLREAAKRVHHLLAGRAAQAEARLSYAMLADLLAGVDDQVQSELPAPQREALETALLRRSPMDSTPDHRAIATGLLTVLHRLSREAPVVLAVDDLQWLDRSSADAIGFAARRLSGQVGILASLRTEGQV